MTKKRYEILATDAQTSEVKGYTIEVKKRAIADNNIYDYKKI